MQRGGGGLASLTSLGGALKLMRRDWLMWPPLARANTPNHTERSASTHVDDVGQVADVIFEDAAVGGLKSQQVLVPGLDGFQLVLRVLGLSLIGGGDKVSTKPGNKSGRKVR